MNIIQKALALQLIDAAWLGSEPSSMDEITDSYINEKIIRTINDLDNPVNLEKLKTDYNNLLTEEAETNRVDAIKSLARKKIESLFPDVTQRNLMARSIELINLSGGDVTTLDSAAQAELQQISKIWDWIKSIRETSNLAEQNNTDVSVIIWPEFI